MAGYLGRDGAVLIGEESTYGTAVSRTNTIAAVSFAGFYQKTDPILHNGLNRPAGFHRSVMPGRVTCAGTMDGILTYENCGMLFEAATGGTPATTGSGPYTHVFANDTSIKSYTVEPIRGDAANTTLVRGAMVNKLQIMSSEGDYVRFKTEWMAQLSNSVSSAGSPSYGTGRSPAVYWHAGTVTINSVVWTIRSVTVTLDNALKESRDHATQYTNKPYPGERSVTIELEVVYDSTVSEAPYTAQQTVVQYDSSITWTGSGNNTFKIDWYNAFVESLSMDVPNGDEMVQKVTLRALTDGTDHAVKFTITNDNSSATAN